MSVDKIPDWLMRDAINKTISGPLLEVVFAIALENVTEREPVAVWKREK